MEGGHSTLIKKGALPIRKKKVAKNYDRQQAVTSAYSNQDLQFAWQF